MSLKQVAPFMVLLACDQDAQPQNVPDTWTALVIEIGSTTLSHPVAAVERIGVRSDGASCTDIDQITIRSERLTARLDVLGGTSSTLPVELPPNGTPRGGPIVVLSSGGEDLEQLVVQATGTWTFDGAHHTIDLPNSTVCSAVSWQEDGEKCAGSTQDVAIEFDGPMPQTDQCLTGNSYPATSTCQPAVDDDHARWWCDQGPGALVDPPDDQG